MGANRRRAKVIFGAIGITLTVDSLERALDAAEKRGAKREREECLLALEAIEQWRRDTEENIASAFLHIKSEILARGKK